MKKPGCSFDKKQVFLLLKFINRERSVNKQRNIISSILLGESNFPKVFLTRTSLIRDEKAAQRQHRRYGQALDSSWNMLEHCYYRMASVVLGVYRNQFKYVWNRINSSPVLIMSLGTRGLLIIRVL